MQKYSKTLKKFRKINSLVTYSVETLIWRENVDFSVKQVIAFLVLFHIVTKELYSKFISRKKNEWQWIWRFSHCAFFSANLRLFTEIVPICICIQYTCLVMGIFRVFPSLRISLHLKWIVIFWESPCRTLVPNCITSINVRGTNSTLQNRNKKKKIPRNCTNE